MALPFVARYEVLAYVNVARLQKAGDVDIFPAEFRNRAAVRHEAPIRSAREHYAGALFSFSIFVCLFVTGSHNKRNKARKSKASIIDRDHSRLATLNELFTTPLLCIELTPPFREAYVTFYFLLRET